MQHYVLSTPFFERAFRNVRKFNYPLSRQRGSFTIGVSSKNGTSVAYWKIVDQDGKALSVYSVNVDGQGQINVVQTKDIPLDVLDNQFNVSSYGAEITEVLTLITPEKFNEVKDKVKHLLIQD